MDRELIRFVSKAIGDEILAAFRGKTEGQSSIDTNKVAIAAIKAVTSYKHLDNAPLTVDLDSGIAITETGIYHPTKTTE